VATTRARQVSGRRAPERVATLRPFHQGAAAAEEVLAAVEVAATRAATAALADPDASAAVAEAIAENLLRCGIEPRRVAGQVLDRALADWRLAEQLPSAALRAQVALAAVLIDTEDVSVWAADPASTPICLATSAGIERPPRRTAAAARLAIEEGVVATVGTRAPTLAVPVSRLGVVNAAVVVRLASAQQREVAERLGGIVARRIGPVLERSRMLEDGEQRERLLVAAAEKRLVRVGYDLHDGPVQDVVVLSEELRLLTSDLAPLVEDGPRVAVTQSLESVREQVCRLADDLRELAQSLETSAVSRQPLVQLLQREASSLTRRASVECRVDVRADLSGLTDSQRITLYRIVQESLANVAEHSGAASAVVRVTESSTSVSLTVSDDGCGFDAPACMAAAARRGRLGLVGMSERVRLLGGVFRVTSAPGRGTTIRVVLARRLPAAD